MGGRHGVAREAQVPVAHARRHGFVALAAGRQEVPLVVLARLDTCRVARAHFRDGVALPGAEGNLGQFVEEPIAVRTETQAGARQLHGLTRAAERARDVVKAGRIDAVAREQIAQHLATMRCLCAAARVERDVLAALQARFDIPVGLAVAEIIEDGCGHWAKAAKCKTLTTL